MKKIILSLAILFAVIGSFAQDHLLTQKTGNINHFNPALVGTQSDFGVQANTRDQWPSLPGSFMTSSLLANYNLKNGLGFGLDLMSNRAGEGILKTDNIKANVNYAFDVNEVEVRSGLSLGYGQTSISWDKLRFEDQIDPSSGFVNPAGETFVGSSANYFTVDLGAAAYYKGLMLATSAMQVNSPGVSYFGDGDGTIPLRFVGMIGYHKEMEIVQLAVTSSIMFQNQFTVADLHLHGQYKFIKLGMGVRQPFGEYQNNMWATASLGVQFEHFSVGYSHDAYSPDSKTTLSSNEVTAAWYIKGLNREKGFSQFMNVIQ